MRNHRGVGSVRSLARGLCVLLFTVGILSTTAPREPADAAEASGSWIVEVALSADPAAVALGVGTTPTHTYDSGLRGFAAQLTDRQVKRLRQDARVVNVVRDAFFAQARPGIEPYDGPQPPQSVTGGLRRIGGLQSTTAKIDGVDERVDVDVAVLDSGVDAGHVDLNVAGGVDCTAGKGFQDLDGHGTLSAGFIGALDNAYGAVGVAPGARIWAVRVLKPNGNGSISALLCGLDWVTDNSAVIEVANLSLGSRGFDSGQCGAKRQGVAKDLVHAAVCAAVARGVVLVASAGNETQDTAGHVPAAYPEVVAVSAFSDTDGLPGGLGPRSSCLDAQDDYFALFSNFGAAVDLAAPGVCVTSTYPGDRYAYSSGTSFSAPFVSGAAALVLSRFPDATPAQVRTMLIETGEPGPIAGDPDAFPEPVLDVSTW